MMNYGRNTLALLGLGAKLKQTKDDQSKGKHNQDYWMQVTASEARESLANREPMELTCGSSACAAGWTVMLNGDYAYPNMYDRTVSEGAQKILVQNVLTEEGSVVAVGLRAQQVLGIDYEVALHLFSASNTNKTVRKAVKMLAEGDSDQDVIDFIRVTGRQDNEHWYPLSSLGEEA